MSQQRIIKILSNRSLTRAELREITDLSDQSICYALKQLLKYDEIEIDKSNGIPVYSIIKRKKRKKRKKRRNI